MRGTRLQEIEGRTAMAGESWTRSVLHPHYTELASVPYLHVTGYITWTAVERRFLLHSSHSPCAFITSISSQDLCPVVCWVSGKQFRPSLSRPSIQQSPVLIPRNSFYRSAWSVGRWGLWCSYCCCCCWCCCRVCLLLTLKRSRRALTACCLI
jgi:hypothetical protein